MAFSNALDRGAPERFPDLRSRTLNNVQGLRAAGKEKLLSQFVPWGPEMATVLNRDLRNAIGHSSAKHVLTTGQIVAPRVSLAYADFVALTAREIQLVLLCLNLVKLLLITEILV